MKLIRLHRRTEALMTLAAVIAFISGAGFDAPSVLPAIITLTAVAMWEPSLALRRRLDPFWKVVAVLLALRAAFNVVMSPDDIVLPMVDLLLLLLVAEVFRVRDTGNDARVYALTFALLVASAAYRPGALFAIAFVAYMAAATVSLMVGHLLHSIERRPVVDVPLRPRFLVQSAALSGIALITSAFVFLAFPRVTRGWISRGLPFAGNVTGFSNRVSLTEVGGQLLSNPELVLRVDFPDRMPSDMNGLHWRGISFDRFDGFDWERSPGLYQQAGSDTVGLPRVIVAQHILGADLPDVIVLFGLHHIALINGDDYRFSPHRQPNGDFNYMGPSPPAYTVYSNVATPTQKQLAADSGAVIPPLAPYLQLPDLGARITALADSLKRGTVTTADKVSAVQRYLKPFTYTLQLPATAREATLEYFLFNRRQGHCEYFSTAMAILLREMGVPTRNVDGFLGGEWNGFGKFLNVTQNQAHSWVEVWYPRYGWVQYDPTPSSLSGIAAQNNPWFAPLRLFLDGIDYRWSHWVLEYDMKTQVSIFTRVASAFRRTQPEDAPSDDTSSHGLLRWIILAGIVIAVFGVLRRSWMTDRNATAAAESAAYLKLRRYYERAGYPPASALAPFAFLERVQQQHAGLSGDVMTVVNLYTRARFGGTVLNTDEKRELRNAVARARNAIRSAGRRSPGIPPSSPAA